MYEIVEWIATRGTQIVLLAGIVAVLTYVAVQVHLDARDRGDQ